MKYIDNEADRMTGHTTARQLLALGYACLAPGTEVEFLDHMPSTVKQAKRRCDNIKHYIGMLGLPAKAVMRKNRVFITVKPKDRKITKCST